MINTRSKRDLTPQWRRLVEREPAFWEMCEAAISQGVLALEVSA